MLPSSLAVLGSGAATVAAGCGYLRRKAAPKRCFPTPSGPHKVLVASHEELNIPELNGSRHLHVQLVAPSMAEEHLDSPSHSTYYRREAVTALECALTPNTANSSWSGAAAKKTVAAAVGVVLRGLLVSREHPDPLPAAHSPSDDKLPLVVFSHGLFGNSQMYTQACRELASYGCVVVALEHQDGTATGTPQLPYKRPTEDVVYSDRSTVRRFRLPHLEQRRKELLALLEYIQSTPAQDLPAILRRADPTQVIFAGHSFGSAGTLHALSKEESLRSRAKLMLLYDTWAWPLPDEAVVPDGIPALSVLSQEFTKGKEVKEILHTTRARDVFWVPESSHQLWSDFAWFVPAKINPCVKFICPEVPHKSWVAASFDAMDKALKRTSPTPKPLHPQDHTFPVEVPTN